MPGMCTSRRTRSGGAASIIASALGPLPANRSSQSMPVRHASITVRIDLLSSTTRTTGLLWLESMKTGYRGGPPRVPWPAWSGVFRALEHERRPSCEQIVWWRHPCRAVEDGRMAAPIRIVPRHPGPTAAAAPVVAPQLTYRGGPLLSAAAVVTAFWGDDWLAGEAPMLTQVNDFFLYVLNSEVIDQLSEYSVPGKAIGHGSLAATAVITDQKPGASVTDEEIQDLVRSQIRGGMLPAPTPNSLYFIYLPPGVDVDLGGQLSCSSLCRYPDS